MFPRQLSKALFSLPWVILSSHSFSYHRMPMTYKSTNQATLSLRLHALPNAFQWISISHMLKSFNMLYMVFQNVISVYLFNLITHTFPLPSMLQSSPKHFSFIWLTILCGFWTLAFTITVSSAFSFFSSSLLLVNSSFRSHLTPQFFWEILLAPPNLGYVS